MATPCAQAKCAYCGLYGALGRCDGCGAPNAPVQMQPVKAGYFERMLRAGMMSVNEVRQREVMNAIAETMPSFPPNREVRG